MATKKEKVQFSHGENFESVEDLLAEAMEKLDEANERIARLLQTGDRTTAEGAVPEELPTEAVPPEEVSPASSEAE